MPGIASHSAPLLFAQACDAAQILPDIGDNCLLLLQRVALCRRAHEKDVELYTAADTMLPEVPVESSIIRGSLYVA